MGKINHWHVISVDKPLQWNGSVNAAQSQDATFSTCQKFLPASVSKNAVIVKWKHPEATTAQPQSSRPNGCTEWGGRVLRHVACRNHVSSVALLTLVFQSARCALLLHDMGSYKPNISVCGAKRLLERCKALSLDPKKTCTLE